MERDDALSEIEVLKEKLDKALYASQKLIDEKDSSNKEFEKMLEKYDRWGPNCQLSSPQLSCKPFFLLFSSQNEVYRLQSRIDTLEADRNRLEIEAERAALAAAKAREDLRKLHDESTR